MVVTALILFGVWNVIQKVGYGNYFLVEINMYSIWKEVSNTSA